MAAKKAKKKIVTKKQAAKRRVRQSAPTPTPPETAGVQTVTDFRLVQTPEVWGVLLQARSPAGLLVPHFVPHEPNTPIPIEAGLRLPQDTMQRLMNQLWSKGLRPDGWKIVMEQVPENQTLVQV